MARRINTDTDDAATQRRVLFEKLAAAKVAKDDAAERYEELAAQARDLLSLGTHTEGRVQVQVQRNRVWNKAKARENFGDDICTMQVDLVKARKFLTGDEFDALYIPGPNKVIVKVLD